MKSAASAILVSLLAWTIPATAHACDCLPESSAATARAGSTLVFSGDVLSKEIVGIPQLGPEYKEYLVRFRVQRYWKGSPSRELQLRTPVGEKSCGFPFETGKAYLVYAIDVKPPFVTLCSRTKPLNDAQAVEDIIRLGKGTRMPAKAPK